MCSTRRDCACPVTPPGGVQAAVAGSERAAVLPGARRRQPPAVQRTALPAVRTLDREHQRSDINAVANELVDHEHLDHQQLDHEHLNHEHVNHEHLDDQLDHQLDHHDDTGPADEPSVPRRSEDAESEETASSRCARPAR